MNDNNDFGLVFNNSYSLTEHKDYINNQLAQIDSLIQYSEQTREEIKTSLWKVLDEIEFQINKIQKPTQL